MESPVIQRDLHKVYPKIVRGEGIYLYDDAGKRYIDGSGGSAAVTAIGHAVPEVIAAMTAQAQQIAYAPTHAFTTDAIEECARIIVEDFAPAGLERVWFVSGGSEATENAVKMALQYHRERGKGSKQIVIGRWSSFHGATLASLGYGGNPGRRRPYPAQTSGFEHIPPCNPYRPWPGMRPESLGEDAAEYLDLVIRQIGADNVAAFIAEPIVGATLGAVPAAPGYFERVREICDRHDVLFIADEVMTGFGRSGTHFAIEQWGVTPDLIACAKGISGGYTPFGAASAKPENLGEVNARGTSFIIGHTACGNPLSCAVGAAVLGYVRDHNLTANAAAVGTYFIDQLRRLQCRHEVVGDVRGRGLLVGMEFVSDRESKAPFPRDRKVSAQFGKATLERGLISYPGQGTANGEDGDHVLYAPPMTITKEQIDEMVAIIDASLGAVQQELSARI